MRHLASNLYWLPAAGWAGTLFWMSHRPAGPGIPPWFLAHDKITHALAFGILALLVYLALRRAHRAPIGLAAALAWLAATVYGGTDEIHQMFVPTRQPDWHDWFADTIGAALAVALAAVASRRRASRQT
jgi:VanZ family protein